MVVLNNLFASVLNGSLPSCISKAPKTQGRDWGNEVPPIAGDQVHDHLRNLSIRNSAEHDEMHPRASEGWNPSAVRTG